MVELSLALLLSLAAQESPPKLLDRESGGAVLDALRWLRKTQGTDGSWTLKNTECRVGTTSLALLAFLGADFTAESKEPYGGIPFGEVVQRGLSFLLEKQEPGGGLLAAGAYKGMYDHCLALLALSEAARRTPTEKLKAAAQKAVDFLVAARNPNGAWRYAPGCGDNDSSVTGWALLALASAERAGLPVPEGAVAAGKGWISGVTDDKGRVGYTAKGQGKIYLSRRIFVEHETRTALAFVALGPAKAGGLDLLLADPPDATKEKVDYLYWFLASGAIRRASGPEGRDWTTWKSTLKPILLRSQSEDGGWPPADENSQEAGAVYATAINTVTLETLSGYMGVFTAPRKP